MKKSYKREKAYLRRRLLKFEEISYQASILGVKQGLDPLFTKNRMIGNTIYGEDKLYFENALTKVKIAVENYGKAGTKKEINKFFNKYGKVVYKSKASQIRDIVEMLKSDYLSYTGVGSYSYDILNKYGLLNSPKFWREFFMSPYYFPLYNKDSPVFYEYETLQGDKVRSNKTMWEDNLLTFIKIYMRDYRHTKVNIDSIDIREL